MDGWASPGNGLSPAIVSAEQQGPGRVHAGCVTRGGPGRVRGCCVAEWLRAKVRVPGHSGKRIKYEAGFGPQSRAEQGRAE